MIDKKILMDNIYSIAKDKKIKIGDLEKTADVSAGYLSKLNKEDNTAVPNTDMLMAIATALGVSLDFLVSVDYSTLGDNEKYFANFIDKLISGTEKQKLAWEIESGAYLNSNREGESFDHPLFIASPSVVEHPETGRLIDYIQNVYQSRFLTTTEYISFGNSYHCELSHTQRLYMMYVLPSEKNYVRTAEEHRDFAFDSYQTIDGVTAKVNPAEVELYLVDLRNSVSPLCSTFTVEGKLRDLIFKLYSIVSGDRRTVNVSSKVKNAIDEFMRLDW